MRLNPNLADAHFALGKALVGKADLDGAIAELKVAVRMKPDSASLITLSVRCLKRRAI
jgi:Flp pilus assembly protein TadD